MSQQVQEECSCPETGHRHHGNFDGSLCQSDNCFLLLPQLPHSKTALYSHEYFIFILLKKEKCAVCTSAALHTNEKLFPLRGGEKK